VKKFNFRLEPLLNFRKYKERIAQQHTAKAQMDVKNCEKQIDELQQEWSEQSDTVEKQIETGISAQEYIRYQIYIDSVEFTIIQEKSRKQQLKKVLKEKLIELNKKSVDKKVMELYRDRLKESYDQEMNKEEQKELDEISSLKTARKVTHDVHE
jgi:flagellar FliJ protein